MEVRAFVVAKKPGNINRWSEGRQEGGCVMTKPGKPYEPVTVPFAATHTGETEHCEVGSTAGLDGTHVGDTSNRSERREMAHVD